MESLSNCFKILIGISFLAVLTDMLMTAGTFRKYVRSILGLIMLLVIINAFANVKKITFDFSWLDEVTAESGETTIVQNDLFQEVKIRIEEKLSSAMAENHILLKEIDVTLDQDFQITSIALSLEDPAMEKQVRKLLKEEFQIESHILSFYEGGTNEFPESD